MNQPRNPLAVPGLADLALHAVQPLVEAGALLRDPVYWGWGVPRGDRHPVLVLPGLLGGDQYLTILRDWLRRIGYSPVRSEIDRLPGWSEEQVGKLIDIAQRAYDERGQRVTIIGHSLGGILARSVAARRPQLIDHVITMGSPLRISRSRIPESVRLTAIYSTEDAIVRHPGAMARDGRTEDIEAPGSHIGLAFNPAVYRVLGQQLPPRRQDASPAAGSRAARRF